MVKSTPEEKAAQKIEELKTKLLAMNPTQRDIQLDTIVVFHLRYNAKSSWQRYCEQMSTCTGHSLQEEEVLSWLG